MLGKHVHLKLELTPLSRSFKFHFAVVLLCERDTQGCETHDHVTSLDKSRGHIGF